MTCRSSVILLDLELANVQTMLDVLIVVHHPPVAQ
jgi:hypothetical protein